MKKRKVGIFGGTFNPPHNGHVASAESFCRQMQLDELLIIPAYIPPHKEYSSLVTCEQRLEMCRLAFSTLEKATVSDIEIKRGGTSYTYLTLQELSNDNVELYFLCGTDMILSMDTWKNPQIIFNLAHICYARRENDCDNSALLRAKCDDYKRRFGANVHEISTDVIEISSSEIRNSEDLASANLPDSVLQYVREKGLYK